MVYLYALDDPLKKIKDLSEPDYLAKIRQLSEEQNGAKKKKKVRRVYYKRNKDGERSFPYSGKRPVPKSKRPKKAQSQTGIIIIILLIIIIFYKALPTVN